MKRHLVSGTIVLACVGMAFGTSAQAPLPTPVQQQPLPPFTPSDQQQPRRQRQPVPAAPQPPAASSEPRAPSVTNPTAEFAGLDKVTGRIIRFEVKIDETVQFGALQVTPRVCYTRPSNEQPFTIGFIEADEITLKNEIRRIFTGWMFAASPGLNAVEHPIYDVWLTDCKGGKNVIAPQGPTPGYEGAVEPAPPEGAPAATPAPATAPAAPKSRRPAQAPATGTDAPLRPVPLR